MIESRSKMTEYKKKRIRGANFSADEISTLVSILADHKQIIECKKNDGIIWQKKEIAWDAITDSFNSYCSVSRNKNSLRKKYEDIKKHIRKKNASNKQEKLKTNGVRHFQPFTSIEKRVIAIMKSANNGNPPIWDRNSNPKSPIIKEIKTHKDDNEPQTTEIVDQEILEDFKDFEYLEDDMNEEIFKKVIISPKKDIADNGISIFKKLVASEVSSAGKTKNVHNNDPQYLNDTERKQELHDMQMKILHQEMEINKARLQGANLDIEIKLIQKQVEEARLQKLL